MCGICGCIAGSDEQAAQLEGRVVSMLGRLSHRGPDARAVTRSGPVVFGHARLSIIDTDERSNQPMRSPQGDQLLVFNGEIYNFLELKAVLRDRTPLRTTGDTEVLLRLLGQEGTGALSQLRGMFALVWADLPRRKILMARDPFGKKPLYWRREGDVLWFASEIRALLSGMEKAEVADPAAFLAYQAPAPGTTFIQGISEVPAGGWVSIENGALQEGHFFSLETNLEQAEAAGPVSREAFRGAFDEAVRRRLIADVPLGAFLSGGIDSTAIVAAMSRISLSPVHTFTIGFKGASDERRTAAATAARFATRHRFLELDPAETSGWVTRAVADMDVPSGDAINTWVVSRAAKEAGMTVALSGLGGDEWFGGYPSARLLESAARTGSIGRLLARVLPASGPLRLEKLRMALGGTPDAAAAASRLVFGPSALRALGLMWPHDVRLERSVRLSKSNALAEAEFFWYCQRLLLRDSDQMSMAHALELRVPFLDVDFLHAAARLNAFPPVRTVSHRKWRFIQMYPEVFDASLVTAPKTGFALPMESWMRGPLHAFTKEGLQAPALANMLDSKKAVVWFDALCKGGRHPGWSRIWLLAVLGHWMEKNLRGRA